MQKISFSASGWETWDVARQPLIREQMPVLIDDDLLFEDAPGSPRPTTVANRYLAELPINGAPAVRTWENSAGCLSAWLTFLQERGVHPFADRRELRGALSMYTEYRLAGPLKARWDHTTWNLHVSILSAFYDWAKDEGVLSVVPFTYRVGRQDGPRRPGEGQEEHGKAGAPSASHDDQASGVGLRRALRASTRWS
ncbi:hypothetical protein SMICM304S_00317 [Streptomyces microflavus]